MTTLTRNHYLYDEYMSYKKQVLMASIYRGALIGCGFFARNHMEAWRREPRAEIVAVCDLDPARARAMASRFGIERVYADAADMLKSETLDFVDVATTAPSHRQLVCLT